jgi:hypothetical protein
MILSAVPRYNAWRLSLVSEAMILSAVPRYNAWRLSLVSEAMLPLRVELRVPRYVMLGGSALLQCDYSVHLEQLHRVEWLRNDKKLFQFVKGRTPPFRNFSTPGAELDVS